MLLIVYTIICHTIIFLMISVSESKEKRQKLQSTVVEVESAAAKADN